VLRAQLALLVGQATTTATARESLDVHWPGYDHRRGGKALVCRMRSLRTQDTEAVTPAPAGLQVPAAVVWGTADRFQKLNPYGRRLASDLDAPLDEIDGGKHFTPEDHPDRIAAAISSVLASAARPGGG